MSVCLCINYSSVLRQLQCIHVKVGHKAYTHTHTHTHTISLLLLEKQITHKKNGDGRGDKAWCGSHLAIARICKLKCPVICDGGII
jgi:hypothetical protein